jgi:hypothetical protein
MKIITMQFSQLSSHFPLLTYGSARAEKLQHSVAAASEAITAAAAESQPQDSTATSDLGTDPT